MADEDVVVPTLWVGLDEAPVVFANQFVGQVQQDEIIVSLGSMVLPPIMAGTQEERREQISAVSHVAIRPVLRFALTRRRAEEMMLVLRDTLEIYDRRYTRPDDPEETP